jgi:hypothetical protein
VEFQDYGELDCVFDGGFGRCRGIAGFPLTVVAVPSDGSQVFLEWQGMSCPIAGITEATYTFTTPGGDYQCEAVFETNI